MHQKEHKDYPVASPVVLVNPPVVRPCEPPAGLAKLAGALTHHNIPCTVIDANLEGILFLLESAKDSPLPRDAWTARSLKYLPDNLNLLRNRRGYEHLERYRRAVLEVNRILEYSAQPSGATIGLANYRDKNLSPISSADLLKASEFPEANPFFPYFSKRILAAIRDAEPEVVGFSINYLSQAVCAFAMMGFLRKLHPGIRIIAGGGLVTSWIKRPDGHNPFADIIDEMIDGPGEGPLLARFGISDADLITEPDYGGLVHQEYLSPGTILPYSTASGCYWRRCTFCPEKAEGNRYLPISPESVVNHLQALTKRLDPSLIHLLDNALSPAVLSTMARQGPGSPWYGFARITEHLLNLDFCMALKQSGCVMLQLGLESGSQQVLDALGKGIDLETASQAFANLKMAGIGTYVYLLFGTPAETEAGAKQTLEFTVRHSDMIDFLNLAVFNLPVFSPDTESLETGFFYEGDLPLYCSFRHPSGWDRAVARRFLDKEFRRHPAITPILRRDPPLFTSSHAPYFLLTAMDRNRRG